MKNIVQQIYNNKDKIKYILLTLLLISIIFDLFTERDELFTGAKIKYLWGIIIFFVSLFSIVIFKTFSSIFFRGDR